MTNSQEVRVTLTLDVDLTQEKKDIKKFINELIYLHTFHSTTHNRMMFRKIDISKIEEEAEIYGLNDNIEEQ